MSTVQRIAKNTAVLLVAQVANCLLAFFYIVYIARHLGAEGFGVLSFAIAFTAIFGIFADLGLQPFTVREVTRDKTLAPKYLANVSLMKIILAAVTFGLIALTINLMDYPQQTITVVYLLGLSIIFTAFTQMVYSIFQAFERMEYQFLGQVLTPALILVGVILAIKYDFSVVGFASLYLYANAAVLVLNLGILRWKFPSSPPWSSPRIEMDWSFWKPTLKQALPFGLSAIFVSLYYHIDTVMLSLMVSNSDEVVGWYNAAYRLVVMLVLMRMALHIAIFPVMSQSYITSKESLMLICERFFKYLLVIALPIGVGTTILATRFISVVYGSEYHDSVIAVQILVWSAVVMYVNFVNLLLHAVNRQVTVTKIIVFGAASNILLNLFVIPRFDYTGAAATTIASQVIMLSIAFRIFSKTGYAFAPSFALKNVARVLIASAIMGCFIWYCQGLHLAILVILSAVVYAVLLFLMKTFDNTDFHILTGVLKGETVLPKLDIEWTG